MRFLDFTFSFYACQTNVSAQKKRSNQLQTKIKIMNKKILFTLVCGALMLTASAQNDNNGSSHGQGMKSQRHGNQCSESFNSNLYRWNYC